MHAFRSIALNAPRVAMQARMLHGTPAAPVRAFLSSSGPAFSNGRAAALRRGVDASKPLPLPWQPRRTTHSSTPRLEHGGGGGGSRAPPRGTGGGGGGGSGGGPTGSGGNSGSASPGGDWWTAYLALLDSHPLATRAVTAAALNLLGDVICQVFFEDGPFNVRRAAIFTAMGGLVIGPILFAWYNTLARLVTGQGAMVAVTKVAVDQLLFAPPFLALILSLLTTAENGTGAVQAKLQQDWAKVVVTNWYLWVPFQFINFRFVPPKLTVAAVNTCAVVWNVILSLLSHAKVEEAKPVAAARGAKAGKK